MLLPLEALKKIEEASLALEFRDLIGIAAYSVSPTTAYKVARRLEWHNDKALSCRYLAMILRDYGRDAFLKLVAKRNPEDYQDICLCDCHLRHWEFEVFLENGNGNGDWEWNCDCDCCEHSECFHAAHTFNYDCEFCDNDGSDENEHICDDCDNQPCDHCNCNGCAEQFTNCEHNCNGYNGCQECPCNDCDENNATIEDEEVKNPSTIPERAPRIPTPNAPQIAEPINRMPEPTNRVERIAQQLQKHTGTNYPVTIFDSPELNAYAFGDRIGVNNSTDKILDDDEMAWLIGHEIEHNIKGHPYEKAKRAEKLTDTVFETFSRSEGFFTSIIAAAAAGFICQIANCGRERQEERVADEAGKEIMRRAGYNPKKATKAIRKLDSQNRGRGGFFSTHPSTDERSKNLEED